MSGRAASWVEFWDRPNRIYVNNRHREVHYARVADDILGILPSGLPTVLDHGCGEALYADRVAHRCTRLYLCDSGPKLRERLKGRFAANAAISVLSPDGVARLPDEALDLVVASSLVQYLRHQELRDLLASWRAKLRPEGRLVLADVIDASSGVAADVAALLRLGWREGFLLAALGGLAATSISDYRRLRRDLGLTAYTEAAVLTLLDEAGFSAQRRATNFGFHPRRMTVVGRRRG